MILITEGCGYIGSHVNKKLHSAGWDTVVLDNLSTGHKDAVLWGHFAYADLCDYEETLAVFRRWPIDAVIHFAGVSQVAESMRDPIKYGCHNVWGSLNLMKAMQACGVRKIVFSSSGAVYGVPSASPIPETHGVAPVNAYGQTKAFVEQMLENSRRAYGLSYVALRYFNAAGADPDGELSERHDPETHLIPCLLTASLTNRAVSLYGVDYPTPDGTCVRDYVHVDDLARAHVLALRKVLEGDTCGEIYNLGSGVGHSVREVIRAVEEVTGRGLEVIEAERRQGDPPVLVGDPGKAGKDLGWHTRNSLRDMIQTAWRMTEKEHKMMPA